MYIYNYSRINCYEFFGRSEHELCSSMFTSWMPVRCHGSKTHYDQIIFWIKKMRVGYDRTSFNSWTNWFSSSYFFLGNRRMSLKTPPCIILFSSPFLSLHLFPQCRVGKPYSKSCIFIYYVIDSKYYLISFLNGNLQSHITTKWKETWTSISIETKNKIIFSKKIDPLKQHIILPNPKLNRPTRDVCLM